MRVFIPILVIHSIHARSRARARPVASCYFSLGVRFLLYGCLFCGDDRNLIFCLGPPECGGHLYFDLFLHISCAILLLRLRGVGDRQIADQAVCALGIELISIFYAVST